jgi:alpha-glucoside transport system substrate-binding protein
MTSWNSCTRGGDQVVVFNDRPSSPFKEFSYLESGEAWSRAGGALFPYLNQDLDAYPTKSNVRLPRRW